MSYMEYLNNNICICCFKPKYTQETLGVTDDIPFEKHHVSYFPQKIAYVHHDCHSKIHQGLYPHLIQYSPGDGRKFWKEGKRKD